MSSSEEFALVVLGLALGAQVFLRPFLARFIKLVLPLSAIIIFSIALHRAWSQYHVWKANELSKFFLPPYQSISYFIYDAGFRFFVPWMFALLAAMLVSRLSRFFNARFGERFFESEEMPIMALGTFLTGYPGFLLYIILVIVGGLLLSCVYTLLSRGRAPLYYAWLPSAIFAIIIKTYLLPASFTTPFIIGR